MFYLRLHVQPASTTMFSSFSIRPRTTNHTGSSLVYISYQFGYRMEQRPALSLASLYRAGSSWRWSVARVREDCRHGNLDILLDSSRCWRDKPVFRGATWVYGNPGGKNSSAW